MRFQYILILGMAMLAGIAGCSKPADAPEVSTPDAAVSEPAAPQAAQPAPEAAPQTTVATEPAPAPESAAVTLPEGFSALYHVHPEMTLTAAETINAETAEYKVSGELRIGPGALLEYYVKYFQDNGWEEDMVMEQEGGIVVVSFKKDGHLQYVDAREGGIGMKITITTGQA